MLDINVEIANLLKGIAPVELTGSEKPLAMPSIYIDQVSNMSDVSFDNRDFLTRFVYQIDVYAETPKKCMEMAQAIDDAMQGKGWTRTNGQADGLQRYIMTYTGKVDEKYNVYKE